jgi:hypothetical protein
MLCLKYKLDRMIVDPAGHWYHRLEASVGKALQIADRCKMRNGRRSLPNSICLWYQEQCLMQRARVVAVTMSCVLRAERRS